MSDGFYFDEFLQFAQNFHKTLSEETFVIDVMNQLGNVLIREVKMKTPVGQYDHTVFFASGGKLLVFEGAGTTKQGGTLRRNWVLDGVKKVGDAYAVTISNNTEYASYVENGHRKVGDGWVEGQFFLKITMEEIMGQLPAIVGPAYKAYLERFGLS
ncbi:HK97 gp10 family phage protein [Listeria monocytogenes]|uniref:HK97 gp10 family phage protein n=1 Tax=Listeria monocytogenes TaxID=1639 RepID=UPI0011EB6504|nr:HK97 gp10 family phage protein [Listeria monocytogenes]TYU82172.1 HK97 gp10 family phage protein [Listeria monocytogenes]